MNKTVLRTIEIIELLSSSDTELTVSEISRQLGLPKSSTHDILSTLLDKGYLSIKNPREKSYELGLKLFQVASAYQSRFTINQVVEPYLKKLVESTGNTAFFAVENFDKIIYLSKIESEGNFRTTAKLGSENELYYTGLGKAVLATYSNEKIEKYLEKTDLVPKTEKTATDRETVWNAIATTRKNGYAIDDREGEENLFCIAAPLYDGQKNLLGAISIAGLYSKVSEEYIEKTSGLITKVALEISKKFGFIGNRLY